MLEIMELLSILLRKGVNVYVVKGNYELKNDIQSKVLTFVFSLASEIKRELISQRTKEALAKRKAEGKKSKIKNGFIYLVKKQEILF